ncbi:MAG: hypothetical protein JWO90_1114 [Solirubrobacterales bacterium]|jgi:phospholipid/cholesterol/gamma-HCH transport system substrate-binding protein|nr:hypothetical protein [Solirubrobacterales bacterium]
MSSLGARLGGRTSLVGLVTMLLVGTVVLANFTGIGRKLLSGDEARTVTAMLANAQQLAVGNPVRVDGVDAGRVAKITAVDGGRWARVEMDVAEDAGPLYADAGANLRWRTVLGSSFFLDLDRGTAGRGELRGTIPAERTTNQVELEDVAGVFRKGARRGLQTLPGELGTALEDDTAVGNALESLARISPDTEKGIRGLRGTRPEIDLRRLVGSTADVVEVLGRSPAELRQVVAGAAATLETTGSRAAAIQSTLTKAPGVLQRTNLTLGQLDGTLALATPLVRDLRAPAGRVGPTLKALNPTVRGADTLLRTAVPLLEDLRPTVRSLARTATSGLPLLTELQPSIDRLQQTILPYLAEVDPGTGKSTTVMIGGTFAGLGSETAGQEDAQGHVLRFALTAGSAPLYLPCQTYVNNPDKAQVAQCQDLQRTVNSVFDYKPLSPVPGSEAPAARSGR